MEECKPLPTLQPRSRARARRRGHGAGVRPPFCNTSADTDFHRVLFVADNSSDPPSPQGLTLVHVRAQLEQLQDTFIS